MAMYGSAAPSLADIAAVTRNAGDGMNGGGWWAWIIMFALFGGWGGDFGNNGNRGGQGTYDNSAGMQRGFDTSTIITKLDGINNGICSLGYDQLAQMNGINNTVMQTGYAIQNSINQLGINNMQDSFALQRAISASDVMAMQNANAAARQLADCCCENRAAVADIKYTMATDACAVNNNIHTTGDAIIRSQQDGFNMLNQTINDRFTQLAMEQKDMRIAELEQKLNKCDLDVALQGTASYILSRTNPEARPSYIVQNPNCCQGPIPVVVQPQNNTCCNQNQGWCNG